MVYFFLIKQLPPKTFNHNTNTGKKILNSDYEDLICRYKVCQLCKFKILNLDHQLCHKVVEINKLISAKC